MRVRSKNPISKYLWKSLSRKILHLLSEKTPQYSKMSRFRIDLPNFLIFKMPEIRRSLNKNLTKLKHIDICVWCKRLRSWDPTEMYCPLSYSNVIVRLLTFVSAWIWSESVQWTFVWWLLYTKFVSSRCVINLFRWNRRSFWPWDFPNTFHS